MRLLVLALNIVAIVFGLLGLYHVVSAEFLNAPPDNLPLDTYDLLLGIGWLLAAIFVTSLASRIQAGLR
jgi:hypothetical protein